MSNILQANLYWYSRKRAFVAGRNVNKPMLAAIGCEEKESAEEVITSEEVEEVDTSGGCKSVV